MAAVESQANNIGLRHCMKLNYEIDATSAASFIILIMTQAKRVV